MLRSIEACGKTGVYGLRYLSQGYLQKEYYHELVRYEMLRKEYLNQTFNFLPHLRKQLERGDVFEVGQKQLLLLQGKRLKAGSIFSQGYNNGGMAV